MGVIAEADIKKDSRNRITLPADIAYEHFHMMRFDDGHIELYPRVLIDPTISFNALRDLDLSVMNFRAGRVGDPVNISELEAITNEIEER